MPAGRHHGFRSESLATRSPNNLPLVSREWRNGVQVYLLLLPFFHSLLTKGRTNTTASKQRNLMDTSYNTLKTQAL